MSEAIKAEQAKLPPDLEQIKSQYNLDDETLKKVLDEARREVLTKKEKEGAGATQSGLPDGSNGALEVPKGPSAGDLQFSASETGGSNPEELRKEILQMVLNILSGNVKVDAKKPGDVHKLVQSFLN
jgi:hypothetical protein